MEPQGIERKLAAVLHADLVDYARLTGDHAATARETLAGYRELMDGIVGLHNGRVVGSAGDSWRSAFGSAADAVECAVEVQRELATRNARLPDEQRIEFRVGINVGDVIAEGDEILGGGANVAARLQTLADAGGICISGGTHQQVENKLALSYEFMGEHFVENAAVPVEAYRVVLDAAAPAGTRGRGMAGLKRWQPAAMAAAAAALLIGAVAVVVWNRSPPPPVAETPSIDTQTPPETPAPPLPDMPSVAVLPFANTTGDPEQEAFADGMTESIITGLSDFLNLSVVSRSSVLAYKGRAVRVDQVGRELGVRFVLEGSVRKSADRVRITAQLIEVATGHHLWADRYDRDLTDTFALQDEITQKIVRTLAGYAVESPEEGEENHIHAGVAEVIEVMADQSRLVVSHQEIEGFMEGMEMSYVVKPKSLLEGIEPGDRIQITIDAGKRNIIAVDPVAD